LPFPHGSFLGKKLKGAHQPEIPAEKGQQIWLRHLITHAKGKKKMHKFARNLDIPKILAECTNVADYRTSRSILAALPSPPDSYKLQHLKTSVEYLKIPLPLPERQRIAQKLMAMAQTMDGAKDNSETRELMTQVLKLTQPRYSAGAYSKREMRDWTAVDSNFAQALAAGNLSVGEVCNYMMNLSQRQALIPLLVVYSHTRSSAGSDDLIQLESTLIKALDIITSYSEVDFVGGDLHPSTSGQITPSLVQFIQRFVQACMRNLRYYSNDTIVHLINVAGCLERESPELLPSAFSIAKSLEQLGKLSTEAKLALMNAASNVSSSAIGHTSRLNLVLNLVHQHNLQHDARVWEIVIWSCRALNSYDSEMERVGATFADSRLDTVLGSMMQHGVPHTQSSLETLFRTFVVSRLYQRAWTLLEDARNRGYDVSPLYHILIEATSGNLAVASFLIDEILPDMERDDVFKTSRLMRALFQACEVSQAWERAVELWTHAATLSQASQGGYEWGKMIQSAYSCFSAAPTTPRIRAILDEITTASKAIDVDNVFSRVSFTIPPTSRATNYVTRALSPSENTYQRIRRLKSHLAVLQNDLDHLKTDAPRDSHGAFSRWKDANGVWDSISTRVVLESALKGKQREALVAEITHVKKMISYLESRK